MNWKGKRLESLYATEDALILWSSLKRYREQKDAVRGGFLELPDGTRLKLLKQVLVRIGKT